MGFIRLILGWFLGNWLKVFMISMIFGAYTFFIWNKASTKEQVACAARASASIAKGIKSHAKIKQQVMQMPESDLDHALSKWMRD